MDDFMDLNGALSLIIGELCCTGTGFLQVDHMEYDFIFFVIAGAAMLFSGFSKAGFGSGASFAGAAVLATVVDPAVALGVTLPLFMLTDVVVLPSYWRKWSWQASKTVIIGGLPGVMGGVWLYKLADADMLRILLGIVSLGFVAWQSLRSLGFFKPRDREYPALAGVFTGVLAGFTSFVSHAGGPPVAVYLLSQGMRKTTYQASTVLIFTLINIFKFVPYAFLGIFTFETLWLDFYLAPFVLIGALLGVKAHFWVPENLCFGLTYIMLTLTGTKLLWDGLT